MRIIKSYGFLISFGIIFSFTILLSCSEGTNPNDKKFILPDKDLSFYDHIKPLFVARCGTESGCHSPFDQNRLQFEELTNKDLLITHTLEEGFQLVNIPLDQIDPDNATLYLILKEGFPDYTDLMPPYPRDKLNSNQLLGIKQWIREGAPE